MNLYQLNDAISQIQNAASDGASPDEVREALEAVEMDFKDKAVQVGYFVRNLTGDHDAIDAEIKRLTERKRSVSAHIDRLKDYLADNLADIKKASDGVLTVSYTSPKPKLDIEDESLIPVDWIKFKTSSAPDKTAILNALKDGQEIEGCKIGQSKPSVTIK